MKTRQQIEDIKRSQKRLRMALILGVVFALVVAAAIITSYLLTKYAGGDEPSTIDPPDIIDGESTYGSSALAYPTMKESDIKRITVNNKTSFL